MQKLHPWEVDVSTTPIEAHKPFGFSSSGVRVLDFTYVKKALRASFQELSPHRCEYLSHLFLEISYHHSNESFTLYFTVSVHLFH
jgi:hypothetical protein